MRRRRLLLLLGNCQLHRFRYVMEINNVSYVDFVANSDFLGDGCDIDDVKTRIAQSSLVVAQPVMNMAHGLNWREIAQINPNVLFVPYIFIDGLFSLSCAGQIGSYAYGFERVADILRDEGLHSVINKIRYGDLPFANADRVHASLAELRRRESQMCAVKISDYIESEYTSRQLFLTHNHPGPELFDEFCARVFRVLGLSYTRLAERTHADRVDYAFNKTPHVFSPYDVDALDLRYGYEEQWFNHAREILFSLAPPSPDPSAIA